MPSNAQNLIESFAEVIGARSYAYSLQDTGAFLYEIPGASVGTTLILPDDPTDGDWYEFADVDGSCANTHPVHVAAGTGATILGGASFAFTSAFCSGKVRYSARTQAWVFISGPGSGDLTAVDAGPGISVSTTGGVATVSNTGVLEVSAGAGVAVGGTTGDPIVSNTGVLALTAGSGIAITGTNADLTITNTEPAGAPITSTTTTAANVVVPSLVAAAIVTSPAITVAAGQKVVVHFSCQLANTGEVVTGGESLTTFLAQFDATTVDTFVQHLVNANDNDAQIVSWTYEVTGLGAGNHTFLVQASADDIAAAPQVVLARLTTILLSG